jgi:hypothetical protein
VSAFRPEVAAGTIATRFGVYPEQVHNVRGGIVGDAPIHPGEMLQFGTGCA